MKTNPDLQKRYAELMAGNQEAARAFSRACGEASLALAKYHQVLLPYLIYGDPNRKRQATKKSKQDD